MKIYKKRLKPVKKRMVNTYLDYNATAPVWPQVIQGVGEAMRTLGNPSSVHAFGREASSLVEGARDNIASLISAKPSQIIFTSGGTEANNLALNQGKSNPLIVSSIEHDSVLKAPTNKKVIDVDSEGVIRLEHLNSLLAESAEGSLVSIMLANNEIGTIQPIKEVTKMAQSHGISVHCDVIQALGKIDVDWQELGVDFMSLSAHKIGGPQGVGALVVEEGLELSPLLKGGGQERYRRAGTENVPGIVGFGIAADLVRENRIKMNNTAKLREKLENGLRSIVPDLKFYGSQADRLPNTSCFSMRDVEAEVQLVAFDLDGVMVSSGSACSSGNVTISHVLSAMGVPDGEASTAIRVSFGWQNNLRDVEEFLATWQKLYFNTRKRDQTRATAA